MWKTLKTFVKKHKVMTGTIATVGVFTTFSASFYYFLRRYYPNFQELKGPYPFVGMIKHKINNSSNSTHFTLFYPSNLPNDGNIQPNCYFEYNQNSVKGLQNQKPGIPKVLWDIINTEYEYKYKKPLFYMDTNMDDINVDVGSLPLIIFSHGNGGNWYIYQQLICSLVSYGIVIACIEHTDKSANCAIINDEEVPYQIPYIIDKESGMKYRPKKWLSKHDHEYHGNQMKNVRIPQCKEVYKYLTKYISIIKDREYDYYNNDMDNSSNDEKKSVDELNESELKLISILKYVNFNQIIFMGHSFGGGSTYFACQDIMNVLSKPKQNDSTIDINDFDNGKICGLINLDPWYQCLNDSFISRYNNEYKMNLPTLLLMSDDPYFWKKLKLIRDNNLFNNQCIIEHCNGLKHTHFSDVHIFAPKFMTKARYDSSTINTTVVNRILTFLCNILPSFNKSIIKRDIDISYNKNIIKPITNQQINQF